MDTELDLLQVCRTCEGNYKLTLVDDIPNFHKLLKTYLDIDPLPQPEAICPNCIKVINDFKDFDDRCKAVDVRLRQKLMKPTEEHKDSISIKDESSPFDHGESEDFSCDEIKPDCENETCVVSSTVEETKFEVFIKPTKPAPKKVMRNTAGKFICDSCGVGQVNKISLLRHFRTIHGTCIRCRPCKEGYENSYELWVHKVNRHENHTEFIYCYFCHEPHKKEFLKKHLKQIHNSNIEFDVKTISIDTENRIEKVDLEFEQANIKCLTCKITYNDKVPFIRHLENIHGVQHKIKNKKDKNFEADVKQLMVGAKSLTGYTCQTCGQFFKNCPTQKSSSYVNLRNHIIRLHMNKTLQCPKCDKVFSLRQDFDNHWQIHVQPELYKCNICTKSFKTHQNIRNHMENHITEPWLFCDECGQGFSVRARFMYHKNHAHTGQRKVKACTICGKTYTSSDGLKNHMAKHEGTFIRLNCGICKKVFFCKDSMKNHVAMGKCIPKEHKK